MHAYTQAAIEGIRSIFARPSEEKRLVAVFGVDKASRNLPKNLSKERVVFYPHNSKKAFLGDSYVAVLCSTNFGKNQLTKMTKNNKGIKVFKVPDLASVLEAVCNLANVLCEPARAAGSAAPPATGKQADPDQSATAKEAKMNAFEVLKQLFLAWTANSTHPQQWISGYTLGSVLRAVEDKTGRKFNPQQLRKEKWVEGHVEEGKHNVSWYSAGPTMTAPVLPYLAALVPLAPAAPPERPKTSYDLAHEDLQSEEKLKERRTALMEEVESIDRKLSRFKRARELTAELEQLYPPPEAK